jgi:trigger factor
MKVDLEDLSPVKKRLSVEVPTDEVDQETDVLVRDYKKKVRVPGFRPGKTPADVIRKRFAKELREEVRDRLVWQSFTRAAEERGLKPIGDPALDEVSFDEGQPLTFKTTFEVMPEFEVKDYREIEVRRPPTDLLDAEVDEALEQLRESRVRHVVEEGREASVGDIVVADVEGTPAGGETFQRERTQVEIGGEGNLPAFNEQLTGVCSGRELEFDVDYPEEYPGKELAGKKVAFRLKVHEVKRRELPEVDDEFARDLGEFESLDQLRSKVREDLQARKDHQAEGQMRQALLDKVLLQNTIALPESLTDREIRHRMEDLVRGLMQQGMDPEKAEVDWKEIRKRQEEPARKAVHARLVLDAIAATEGIEVQRKEIDERIQREAQRVGESPDKLRSDLKKHGGMEALKSQLLREATLDYLTSVANIQNEE